MQLEDESAKLATVLNAQQVTYFRALVGACCCPPYACNKQDAVELCLGRAHVNVDTGDVGAGGDRV